jgi:hypothetical protein
VGSTAPLSTLQPVWVMCMIAPASEPMNEESKMPTNDFIQRGVLPIPDRKPVGLTTYDAKDPDTRFPPITPLRPPVGCQ